MSSFWSSCLSQFEQELPPQQFNTWIRPLRLEGEEDLARGLRLLAPNGFILKWVKERYLARIEALGSEYFSVPVNITLTLGERVAVAPNQVSGATGRTANATAGEDGCRWYDGENGGSG
jgi:chromosomal replication initiator protein